MGLGRTASVIVLTFITCCTVAPAQSVRLEEFQAIAERMVHLRVPDARAAARLRRLRPKERIPPEAVAAVVSWDAGPLVRRELESLATKSAGEAAPVRPDLEWNRNPVQAPPILDGERALILETIRLYAQDYARSIPNFLCLRDTRFLADDTGTGRWRPQAHVAERLSHVDGEDEHRIVEIDGEPVSGDTLFLHGGITVSGEFGNVLRRVFEDASHTAFFWLGKTGEGDQARVRIGFRVEKEFSSMRVSAGDDEEELTGYAGEVLASPETGQVFRIQLTMDELPDGYPMRGSAWDIHYGPVKVEEEELLLPVRAVTEAYQEGVFLRNEASYRDYQHYRADSSIRFERAEPELLRP